MTITQTVEIPTDRRITVPREVPTGTVIITFTTPHDKNKGEFEDLLFVSNSTLDFWDNEDDEVWNNV
ncbi:MAG: hypothetical protein FWB86_06105 [Treponema sp.]|nr:hypothetical protein [Treponema sp.]MCL2250752.1 hypothetical protein [Treponema sp.]